MRANAIRSVYSSFAIAALTMGAAHGALADDNTGDGGDDETYIADFVEDFEAFEGLFTLYRDPENGKLYMEITADQLGLAIADAVTADGAPPADATEDGEDATDAEADVEREDAGDETSEDDDNIRYTPIEGPQPEFIYFLHTVDGSPYFFHFRGAYRDNQVFSLHKRYESIEFRKENTSFYFDPENALSRAADANVTKAILAKADIEVTSEDGLSFLIPADGLFKSEALHQVAPSRTPGAPPTALSLGSLSKDLTSIDRVRSYPNNTDVVVEYVYTNDKPVSYGDASVTDARSIAIKVQHSFLAMPENDYQTRPDDYRVGYFYQEVDDLTSQSYTPYRDVINRWHLVKKDPEAAVSDPVEPIVWWIENTTPVEFRDTIRQAALSWNTAFEAAGFSNAIQIEVQPDDAKWDAGDIRYNVLRWTSSPNPPFGGYGPSFTNPRTGQILGADIMLEFIFVTNRVKYEDVFTTSGLPALTALPDAHIAPPRLHGRFCSAGLFKQRELMLGVAHLMANGAAEVEITDLIHQTLASLIVHELGHTIGLAHNFKASQITPSAQLHDEGVDLLSSVMDYDAINIAMPGEPQGQFVQETPGPYDIWAVEYGYTPPLADADAEAARIEAHLAKSTDPIYDFGNDADDMRAPGKGIDPRAMVGDLASDNLEWADGRFDLINTTFAGLKTAFAEPGDAYQDLLIGYAILTSQAAQAAQVASRYIGGVYVQRADAGQDGATQPYTPVPRKRQELALDVLSDHVFAPTAFDAASDYAAFLQPQRRGWNFFTQTEDPKLHQRALAIQGLIMAHILHPSTLQRMTDSRIYAAAADEYPVAEFLADLTNAVFEADIKSEVNTYRQQLQIAYVQRLIAMVSGVPQPTWFGAIEGYDIVAQSAALASLQDIADMVRPGLFGHGVNNAETVAHREHILVLLASIGIQ